MTTAPTVHVTDRFEEYDAAAAEFLAGDPVRHTIALTVAATLRAGGGYGPDPWFAWAEVDGRVAAAAFRTPPYLVGLGAVPAGVAAAIGAACSDRELPGAIGTEDVVAAFAAGAGLRHRTGMREVQYALRTVVTPPRPPGEPRRYLPDQHDLVVRWLDDFHAEAGLAVRPDPELALANRVAAGAGLWLWWTDDVPVCLVGISPPVAGVPRIGPVWTPPEHRRRGYAAALTAHVCADAIAAGALACTLYADADNRTANGVYLRLGFEPVGTVVEAEFRR